MVDRLFTDARLAGLYDALCPLNERGDIDFYLDLVMAAESVLDVGCGTGTLLHEARAAGHQGRLCGVDPAPGMLAQARRRSDVEWILGDLSTVRFDQEFDLVVMSGHAFQVFLGDEELRDTFAAVRASLADGGRFGFETRNPLARAWERWTPEHAVSVTDPDSGVVRAVPEVTEVDGQFVTFRWTYSSPVWERPEESWSTLRFLDLDTLSTFVSEAGLAVDQRYGDWDRGPLTDTSPEIIMITRR